MAAQIKEQVLFDHRHGVMSLGYLSTRGDAHSFIRSMYTSVHINFPKMGEFAHQLQSLEQLADARWENDTDFENAKPFRSCLLFDKNIGDIEKGEPYSLSFGVAFDLPESVYTELLNSTDCPALDALKPQCLVLLKEVSSKNPLEERPCVFPEANRFAGATLPLLVALIIDHWPKAR